MDWGNIFSQAITQGLGVQAVIFALAAVGLNVHFGYRTAPTLGRPRFPGGGRLRPCRRCDRFSWVCPCGYHHRPCGGVLLAPLFGIPPCTCGRTI